MLKPKDVKEGRAYDIDGEVWYLHAITRPGNGESVTLCDAPPGRRHLERSLAGTAKSRTMQMRQFQRAATIYNEPLVQGAAAGARPAGG